MKLTSMIKYTPLIALIFSAGCATSKPALDGQLDAHLGKAVKQNIANQAVAPSPEQKANTFIPADPARTGLARQNYRNNTVPDPERVNNSNE